MQQRVAHELVEGHHHRDRVAGQPEEKGVADAAEGHRPSRAHRDFPEQHLAELRHQRFHEIGFSHRDAAGGNDGIGRRRLLEHLFELLGIIAHHSQVGDLDTEALEHAVQRVAVRVVDLALFELRADRRQLVPGREERHAELVPHLDRGLHQRKPALRRVVGQPGAHLLVAEAAHRAAAAGIETPRRSDLIAGGAEDGAEPCPAGDRHPAADRLVEAAVELQPRIAEHAVVERQLGREARGQPEAARRIEQIVRAVIGERRRRGTELMAS